MVTAFFSERFDIAISTLVKSVAIAVGSVELYNYIKSNTDQNAAAVNEEADEN